MVGARSRLPSTGWIVAAGGALAVTVLVAWLTASVIGEAERNNFELTADAFVDQVEGAIADVGYQMTAFGTFMAALDADPDTGVRSLATFVAGGAPGRGLIGSRVFRAVGYAPVGETIPSVRAPDDAAFAPRFFARANT